MSYLNVVGCADANVWLAQLPANSIDSVVTDPPAGIGFMGKGWDVAGDHGKGGTTLDERAAFVASIESIMRACYRALKPGGHALVWALPRTSHWTAWAIQNAGFEVRDVGVHLYGSGFPKSLDVGKAVDAQLTGGRSDSVGLKKTNEDVRVGKGRTRKKSQNNGIIVGSQSTEVGERTIRDEPATEEGTRWKGYGTALKPASEHWILARKPLDDDETVATNTLKWGTGGINIDACRIACDGGSPAQDRREAALRSGKKPRTSEIMVDGSSFEVYTAPRAGEAAGRWPANLTLDEEAAKLLDEQSGVSKSSGGRIGNKQGVMTNLGSTGWTGAHEAGDPGFGDTGGASRFFYTAKAAAKEKWHYCRRCTVVFQRTDEAEKDSHAPHAEDVIAHPTPKSIDLMEWLIRLVTPAGGIVLDPFCGTGTTAVAAKKNGFNFVTCDLDENYVKIAQARLASVSMTEASRTSAGYFCPGCKAKGEIKLLDKPTVETAKAAGKKITCTKCMGRFTAADLGVKT